MNESMLNRHRHIKIPTCFVPLLLIIDCQQWLSLRARVNLKVAALFIGQALGASLRVVMAQWPNRSFTTSHILWCLLRSCLCLCLKSFCLCSLGLCLCGYGALVWRVYWLQWRLAVLSPDLHSGAKLSFLCVWHLLKSFLVRYILIFDSV